MEKGRVSKNKWKRVVPFCFAKLDINKITI